LETLPRNQWYVAAWSREVGDAMLARTICGEPIVLYRTGAGDVVALEDRCAHRRYPLSLGSRVGDSIQCGYHGFTYDCAGQCVSIPGQPRIPSKAKVTAYPVVERSQWIWIFIGEVEKADTTDIPDTHWLDDPKWAAIGDVARLNCRYSLLVDNLLDLSHETYLHAGFIGTPEVAATPITTEVDEAQQIVTVSRHMEGAEIPAFYERSTGITSPIDRWQDIEYHPVCFYRLDSRIAPAGIGVQPDGTDSRAAHMKILYGITPETETTTLDFWAVARDFAIDDDDVTKFLDEMQRTIVQQDVDALDVLESIIDAEARAGTSKELSVLIDRGGLAGRRMIEKQLQQL